MSRPDRQTYALGIAKAVSVMGDCTRRQVGAVIIDSNKRLAGAGYNGTYPGGPSCLKGDCPRGRHYQTSGVGLDDHWCDGCEDGCHADDCVGCGRSKYCGEGPCPDSLCICEKPWPCPGACACGGGWPCPDAVAPGSSYDTGAGTCIATHAEANAVADVDNRARLDGAVMYVTEEPCEGCVRHIRNTTRISTIIWPQGAVGLP